MTSVSILARLHSLADGVPNLSLEATKGLLVDLLQILNYEYDVSVDPLVDGILKLFQGAVHGRLTLSRLGIDSPLPFSILLDLGKSRMRRG